MKQKKTKILETKYIVAIIISVILGVSILGYGYLDYRYKKEALEQKIKSEEQTRLEKVLEETKKQQQSQEKEQLYKEGLSECLNNVQTRRKELWAGICRNKLSLCALWKELDNRENEYNQCIERNSNQNCPINDEEFNTVEEFTKNGEDSCYKFYK